MYMFAAIVVSCLVLANSSVVETTQNPRRCNTSEKDSSLRKNTIYYITGHEHSLCSPRIRTKSGPCANSVNFYCEQLSLGKRWALGMHDATAKSPGGVYGGQLLHLGQFDECLDVAIVEPSAEAFVGKYCLAEYSLSEIENNRPDQEFKDFQIWHWLQVLERETFLNKSYGRRAVIQLAWCVPSICSSEELADLLVHLVNDESVNIDVPDNKCQTTEGSSLKTIDIVSLCILSVLIILTILSTIYDCLSAPKDSLLLLQRVPHRSRFLLAFSVFANWRRIFEEDKPANLKCVNGLRALSVGWVVLGHTLLYYNSQAPSTVVNRQLLQSQEIQYMGFTNAHLAADTFILVSALLICYKFLEQVDKEEFNIIKYYIHRLIRVTPALAIMVLLSVSLLNHVGSGPLWSSIYDEVKRNCETNWWSTLLYVNNYVNPNAKCLPQSWYLSVQMQLFWLSPLVLIPLWKSPLIGKCWIGLLLLLGIATPFTIVYLMEIRAGNLILLPEEELNDTKYYYYEATHARFSAWLIGIILGYILHNLRNVKHLRLPKKFIALGWTLATVLMLTSIYTLYPFQRARAPYQMNLSASFYLALHRPAWALGVAWVVFACGRAGCGGFITSILSWRVLQPLSRLSYGIFLTHISVINLLVGLSRTSVHTSDFNTFLTFWSVFSLSTLSAIPLVLCVEFPVLALEGATCGKDSTETVDEDELPSELPPKLKSPFPLGKTANMFEFPEMRQVRDGSEGLPSAYSPNLNSAVGFQKPLYRKELLNSEPLYDVPDASHPGSSIYYEINPHMASEKITNFNNLSPVTQAIVSDENVNLDETSTDDVHRHKPFTTEKSLENKNNDEVTDVQNAQSQQVSINTSISRSDDGEKSQIIGQSRGSTSDDDVRL